MKPAITPKIRIATLFLNHKTMFSLVTLASLVLSVTPRASATLMDIAFDDGGKNAGSGSLDVEVGYAVSGNFVVTEGLAAGNWTLAGGTPSSPGSGLSPGGHFNYDNMVSLGSDLFLTGTGGLLFTDGLGDELNIWANGPGTYCMGAANSAGTYYVEAGFYPGFSDATDYGTVTIANNPGASVTPPTMTIRPAANGVTLSWPVSENVFRLLQNSESCTTNWVANTNEVTVVNGNNQVTVPVTCGSLYFQLVNP